MGLFTKRKEKLLAENQAQLAGQIARRILSAQRRSAVWLNTRASKLKRQNLIMLLVVLGLGFGLWCMYLMLSPLL